MQKYWLCTCNALHPYIEIEIKHDCMSTWICSSYLENLQDPSKTAWIWVLHVLKVRLYYRNTASSVYHHVIHMRTYRSLRTMFTHSFVCRCTKNVPGTFHKICVDVLRNSVIYMFRGRFDSAWRLPYKLKMGWVDVYLSVTTNCGSTCLNDFPVPVQLFVWCSLPKL